MQVANKNKLSRQMTKPITNNYSTSLEEHCNGGIIDPEQLSVIYPGLNFCLVSKIRGLAQVQEASPVRDTARFQYIWKF